MHLPGLNFKLPNYPITKFLNLSTYKTNGRQHLGRLPLQTVELALDRADEASAPMWYC